MKEHDETLARLQSQYQDLAKKSATNLTTMAEQRRELRALIRRVVEMGPNLFDDEGDVSGGFVGQSSKLQQLLRDCQEVLK